MARKPRFTIPGIPQHVIQQDHNREPCFYSEDDCNRYLDNLHETAKHSCVVIHVYILMTNYVHLLVTTGHAHGITHMMQDTGRKYVRYINSTYKRTGSLWEGRYKASLVDSEAYLLTCMRYIEMNPVRAGMVNHPGDYHCSSYHCNSGFKNYLILEPHPVYQRMADSAEQRQYAYHELFNKDLDKEVLHVIREMINQELVLGRDDFKDKIETMTQIQTKTGVSGRPKVQDSDAIYYVL